MAKRYAQIATAPGGGAMAVYDEDVLLPAVTGFNFSGDNVSVVEVSGIAEVTVSGGGGSPALPPAHIYVAPSIGSDANDGLTPSTPLLTITRAINMVGEAAPANYAPIIHLESGTYDAAQMDGVTWPALTRGNSGIIFLGDGAGQVGDDGCVEVEAGTFTAMGSYDTFGTNNTITTVGGASEGNTIEITSGANAGQRRTVRGTDYANTYFLHYGFTTYQASGAYRLFSPGVVLEGNYVSPYHQMTPPLAPPGAVCVWANIRLSSSGYLPFRFTSGVVCFFGVFTTGSHVDIAVNALYSGEASLAIPGSPLGPLAVEIPDIVDKWSGWGYFDNYPSGGDIRTVTFSSLAFATTISSISGVRGYLRGLSCDTYFYDCDVVIEDSVLGSTSVFNSVFDIRSTCFVGDLAAYSKSFVRSRAKVSGTIQAKDGSTVLFNPNDLPPTGYVAVLNDIFTPITALPTGDTGAPGTPVVTVDPTPSVTYFDRANKGIIGADGSVVLSTAGYDLPSSIVSMIAWFDASTLPIGTISVNWGSRYGRRDLSLDMVSNPVGFDAGAGRQYVTFTGVEIGRISDFRKAFTAKLSGNSPFTVYAICSRVNNATTRILWEARNGSGGYIRMGLNTSHHLFLERFDTSSVVTTGPIVPNGHSYIACFYDGSTVSFRMGGVDYTGGVNNEAPVLNDEFFCMGNTQAQDQAYDRNIFEVMFYTGVMGSGDITSLEAWITTKYVGIV